MNIHYFAEDIKFELSNQDQISEWVFDIIKTAGFEVEELNYIFCSDEYLLKINKEHLNHDYYTDIITFDNSEKERFIESDIFISIDRVRENAKEHNVDFTQELHRIIIHGVLHLLGYEDKTFHEQNLMREKEDACISLLKN